MIPLLRRQMPQKRRTLTYTRRGCARKPPRQRPSTPRCEERPLFDRPRDLPVATLHGGSVRERLAGWLAARWAFLRPRALPVVVAAVGMFIVLNAVNYLAHPREVAASAAPAVDTSQQYGFHIKLVLQQ